MKELTPHEKKLFRGSAAVYAWIIPLLQKVGREFGYAIAIHGSLVRDLDLICVPWTEDAKPAKKMINEFHRRLGGVLHKPVKKPHGRVGWTIVLDRSHFYIDLSVMPLVKKAEKIDG